MLLKGTADFLPTATDSGGSLWQYHRVQ